MAKSNDGFLSMLQQDEGSKKPISEESENWPLWRLNWARFRLSSNKKFPYHLIPPYEPMAPDQNTHEPQTILLLDGACDLSHPDLTLKAEYLFKPKNSERMAIIDHATAMASIAVSNDFGFAPKSKLYNAPVVASDQKSFIFQLQQLIEILPDFIRAQNNNVIIVGTFLASASRQVDHLIETILSFDKPVIWAAGNQGQPIENFSPTRISEIISVGASSFYDTPLWENTFKTNYSKNLSVFAPGKNIYSSWITDRKHNLVSGTSPAAMIVASTLANNSNVKSHSDALKHLLNNSSQDLLKMPLSLECSNRMLFEPKIELSPFADLVISRKSN
jgi:hypothetical protein